MDEKKYIYNHEQAKYYISHGVLPLDVDIHFRTKCRFWVFDRDETAVVYDQWCIKCEEHKRQLSE